MKTTAIAIFFLILSGCAMSVPKEAYLEHITNQDIGTTAIEEYPEYAECFGLDKDKARDQISAMWYVSIDEVAPTMPENMSAGQIEGYAMIISQKLESKFWEMNKDSYLPDSLSPAQVRKCRQVVKK